MKNPRGKAVVFFAGYFIFFVILLVMIGNNHSSLNQDQAQTPSGIATSYRFDRLNKANYHYRYQITSDEEEIVYDGVRNQTKEKFTVQKGEEKKEYFNNDGLFLVKNNLWELGSSPYLYEEFLKTPQIEKLLTKATLLSKTEYQNQETEYVYQISTTSLVSYLEGREIDLMDDPNELTITVKENEVVKMKWNLSSYATYLENKDQLLWMILEYDSFQMIEPLELPK